MRIDKFSYIFVGIFLNFDFLHF